MNEPTTSTENVDIAWIPVAQAAVLLGLTERHVRRLCVAGSMEARRTGSSGRWSVSAGAVAEMAATLPKMSGHGDLSVDDVRTLGGTEGKVVPGVDRSSGASFDELERFALQSEIAQLRLQLQAVSAERDQARRAEARALMLAAAHRQAFDTLSDATLSPVALTDQ
jgi:hypothetical protein